MTILSDYSLKHLNTFGVEAKAKYFVEINQEQDLVDLFAKSLFKNEKKLILGGGSNILFTKDYDGLVIKISIKGISVKQNNNDIWVTAGAGEVWNDLVQYCIKNNYAGIENLSLIPGNVGASPVQNIGAYGVEIKDVLFECNAFQIATGQFRVFSNADCHFSYRESVFKSSLKGQYIITSVTYKLSKKAHLKTHYGAVNTELANRGINEPTISDVSKVISEIRINKLPDPSTIGNAGSFFKNPIISTKEFEIITKNHIDIPHYPADKNLVKLAAGWLIEQCGFKGLTIGNTGTWKNQALVLVNHGKANGQEIFDFSESIIQSVFDRFGVKLEREVNIL